MLANRWIVLIVTAFLLSGCFWKKTPEPIDDSASFHLIFHKFSQETMETVENNITTLPGYLQHRLIEINPEHYKYHYQSTLSSAMLNRNIHKMLKKVGIEGQVSFFGNTYAVTKTAPKIQTKPEQVDTQSEVSNPEETHTPDPVISKAQQRKQKKIEKFKKKLMDKLGKENLKKIKEGDWKSIDF